MKTFLKIIFAAVYCSIACNIINWGFGELIALFHTISTSWSIVLFLIVLFFCGTGGTLAALLFAPVLYIIRDCKAAHYLPLFSIVVCGLYSLAMPWVLGVSSFGIWYWILHIVLTILIFQFYLGLFICVFSSLIKLFDD